ncbi:MAG: SMC family ATPase [Pelosinus sp.]|nr:SMC family ATPase [Pelosinus sp.]
MKPLCLTIQAFGPYADCQTIDFGDLQGRSFFLIHGPTGSGKTTVLDAICFALYGDCSGALRDSKAMRSDYAEAGVMTTIEFVFALGDDTYQIVRTPEQMRPKKRGDGLTAMVAEAELYQLDGKERKLLVSGWSKVTEKVEVLLGFKSNQFRQVVLLPQGEFRRLLTANSAERQEIMQALFKTDFYRQIEETLKSQAQTIKKEYEELVREENWVLREAGAEAAEELVLRLKRQQAASEKTGQELKGAARAVQLAQKSLAEGTLQQEKLLEKMRSEEKLRALSEKAPLVEEKRSELARAKEAAGILDIENMLKQLGEECCQAAEIMDKEEGALLHAKAAHNKAQQLLELELKKEPEREKAAAEVLCLQEIEGKLAGLTTASQALAQQKRSFEQAEVQYNTALKKLEKVQAELRSKSEKSQGLVESAIRSEGLKSQFSELSQQIIKLQEYKDATAKWQIAQGKLKEAKEAADSLNERYLAAKTAFAVLQEAWLGGQAAVMAAQLQSGAPCPVCGSTLHPKLAAKTGILPDEVKVKAQQKNVEVLEKEREASLSALGKLQTSQDTLFNRAEDLKTQLGETADISIDTLQKAAAEARAEYQKALQAQKEAEMIKQDIEKLTAEEQKLTKQKEEAALQVQTLTGKYQAAAAVVEERKSLVPAEFHQPAVLTKARQRAKDQLEKLKTALEAAKNQVEQADRQKIKSQAALQNARQNSDKLHSQRSLMQKTFDERLCEAGFSDLPDYQSAKKSPAYVEKLAERIAVFEQDYIAVKERSRLAFEAAKDLVAPDLAALRQTAAEAQKKYEDILANDTRLKAAIAQIEGWQDKLGKLAEKRGKVEGEYSVIGRLSEVANGGNEYKLTFQRFVLGALLEDVAHAANQRLLIMSRGRYELQRTMDRARKNAAGGLDLEVFDSHTGVARSIGTLSGGEMFLASLSLALGLADVVQSYAGGIKLDTILVDEGFGTLDPETLDIALKALLDLQKGGRLVGIISHVPELKERIDARLEVWLTDKGSRAEFKVG